MKTNWIGILIFVLCFYLATGFIMLNYHSKKQENLEKSTSELIAMMNEFDNQTIDTKTAEENLNLLIEKAKDHIGTDKQAIEFDKLLIEIENLYLSIPNKELNENGIDLKKKIVFHIKVMNDEIEYVLISRSYFPFLKPFFNF